VKELKLAKTSASFESGVCEVNCVRLLGVERPLLRRSQSGSRQKADLIVDPDITMMSKCAQWFL